MRSTGFETLSSMVQLWAYLRQLNVAEKSATAAIILFRMLKKLYMLHELQREYILPLPS